ncbi:sulfur carrier protein ThiS [Corynebacterium lowii]|uniref:Sulfur carrier protein ThiS n=1 Tax=Corynebacterium lowii TaxID=1544413 RepID=A0A0Q1E266_9CORY|nr:sulfur carrier protein ThiS [Corynebacterium lowii]KQB86644.1 sulfur carrier protein ThiS [Corynebacterium lowii]MDP9851329.1 sulfur carrier protein [Corynebacterium lowii]
MISYTLNGKLRQGPACSVAELVDSEVGTRTGVAVAIDGAVVPASQWSRTLAEGNAVDILTAVQGG